MNISVKKYLSLQIYLNIRHALTGCQAVFKKLPGSDHTDCQGLTTQVARLLTHRLPSYSPKTCQSVTTKVAKLLRLTLPRCYQTGFLDASWNVARL